MSSLRYYFAAFVFLVIAFLVQWLVVVPLQGALFPSVNFSLSHLISVPFGAGLVIVLMMGFKGLPLVILGKAFLETSLMDVAPMEAVIHGLHDGAALLLALLATAYMLRRDLKHGLLMQSVCASTLVRQAFFMTIMASLIDGVLHTSLNLGSADAMLPMRYLMSHLLGGASLFAMLYLLRFKLSQWVTVKDA